MVEGLRVYHSPSRSLENFSDPWMNWRTCLRQIVVGHGDWETPELTSEIEVYEGQNAYRFLVEVGCGLHSPMVAETEVFGQFKKFIEEFKNGDQWLQDVLESIRLDIKRVRSQHLIGLGSQSYGSLIRKKVRGLSGVSFIGSGQLVEEILPWLAKHGGRIDVFVRSPEKYRELEKKYPFAAWKSLTEMTEVGAMQPTVVLCAPMSAVEVEGLFDASGADVTQVYDLRGESKQDPMSDKWAVECLHRLFDQIQSDREQAEVKLSKAKQEISALPA